MTALNEEDIELGRWLYSAWRHLSEFRVDAAMRLPAVGYAGRATDLLGRLRGLETYDAPTLGALALDASIDRMQLEGVLMPQLEALGICSVERDGVGRVMGVRALVLSEDDVMAQAASLWRSFAPEPEERGAMALLRAAANLPLTLDEARQSCTAEGLSEEHADRAVELAVAVGLARRTHNADFGEDFFFNDFLWGENIDRTTAALSALPSEQREALRSLLEELHRHEGRPLREIESANRGLVKLAVVHGLIETTDVTTTDGKLERFAFTPRFRGWSISREQPPDALSQIRLVMASFAFATRYARFRLNAPEAFIQSLIDRGYAGNASPIGTDYPAMVLQRIVDVEPTEGGRFQFRAVKTDTLERALDTMRAGALLRSPPSQSGAGLFDQQFTDPIASRLRLGQTANRTPLWDGDLLAAVKDSAQGGRFRPR